jgi:hypothetical protein
MENLLFQIKCLSYKLFLIKINNNTSTKLSNNKWKNPIFNLYWQNYNKMTKSNNIFDLFYILFTNFKMDWK